MITLAPIAENIQNTLKQKIAMLMAGAGNKTVSLNDKKEWVTESIGTTLSENGEIIQNYMSARTPWLRMVSFTPKNDNLEAVIIQGGELSEYGRLRSGLENREVNIADTVSSDGKLNFNGLYQEGNIPYRPIAGIKDLDVGYKGGGMKLGATREAQITWSCWDFKDLERLTPHFLKEGRSVLVEWGWTGPGELKVNDRLLNIFTKKNGKVVFDKTGEWYTDKTKSLNQMILKYIQEQNGHYDAMFGLITNFTWSVRDDGGFDCNTTLIAPGVTMLQKTVQRTSRSKTFSRLPAIGGLKTINAEPERYEKEEDGVTNKKVNDKDVETEDWTNWKKESEAIKSGNAKAVSWEKVKGLGAYITFREYMSDFAGQITSNIQKNGKSKNILQSTSISFPAKKLDRENEKIDIVVQKYKLGSPRDGSSLWVTWGWFEDNVLSRFFGTIVGENTEKKVIGEFRSMEQAVGDDGRLLEVENKPLMQATRFKNSPYIVTMDTAKWIIIKDTDPIITSSEWDAPTGWVKDFWKAGADKTKDQINKNTEEHLVIRNVLFNVKYLSDELKDEIDLLSGVNGIWSAFANEYGGVYRFKVDYDDTGHRLFLKEQSYSEFKVSDLLETMKNKAEGDLETGKPSLFVFPTFEAGSIVKSNNLSAKLPNRMKIAAMYGANKPKSRSKKDLEMSTDGHDDLISTAWGRLGKSSDISELEEGKDKLTLIQVRQKTLNDLIADGMDFPSKNNQKFGRQDADPQKSLVINSEGGTIIHDSIFDEINVAAKEELLRRKRAAERESESTGGDSVTSKEVALTEQLMEELQKELQNDFDTFLGGGTTSLNAGKLSPITGLDFYEWVETDNLAGEKKESWREELSDEEKKKWNTGGESVGYTRVKLEIKYYIEKSLRSARDGIFAETAPIVPVDFNMDIDGTGGLYPGNSFHSSYLPDSYKDKCLFQISGVDHRISGGEWTTSVKGQVRVNPK